MTDSLSAPALDVRKLSYSFKARRALSRVTFRVDTGTIHGFVGPNGAGKTTTLKTISTLLVPDDGWWTATWNALHPVALYVDVTTPARWSDGKATLIDLDLDVVRDRDDRVRLIDEDEFVEHQRTLGYPPEIIENAAGTARELVAAVSAHAEPFGVVGAQWLGRALADQAAG